MASSKIDFVSFNNRKRAIEVQTKQGAYELPFAKLTTKPTKGNPIVEIFVDKELARRCVTFKLKDGQEDSVPLEAFLDYNRDPEYLRQAEVHKLTVKAIELVENSGLAKRFICRQMGTSLSQLSRLLDPTNYDKSIDQMIRLLTLLGAKVEIKVA